MPHARAEDRAAYAAARRARVRQEMTARLGDRCEECGAAGDLKFSHRDPEARLFAIDGNLGRPRAVLEAEVDKCRLLCARHYRPSPRGARYHATGEDAATALLTENEARAIKNSSGSHREVAEQYAVSSSTVRSIRSGRTWKHLHS